MTDSCVEIVSSEVDILIYGQSSEEAYQKITQEIQTIGGLMLPPTEGLQLNQDARLCVCFEQRRFWAKARVVHCGPHGIALEVKAATPHEDKRFQQALQETKAKEQAAVKALRQSSPVHNALSSQLARSAREMGSRKPQQPSRNSRGLEQEIARPAALPQLEVKSLGEALVATAVWPDSLAMQDFLNTALREGQAAVSPSERLLPETSFTLIISAPGSISLAYKATAIVKNEQTSLIRLDQSCPLPEFKVEAKHAQFTNRATQHGIAAVQTKAVEAPIRPTHVSSKKGLRATAVYPAVAPAVPFDVSGTWDVQALLTLEALLDNSETTQERSFAQNILRQVIELSAKGEDCILEISSGNILLRFGLHGGLAVTAEEMVNDQEVSAIDYFEQKGQLTSEQATKVKRLCTEGQKSSHKVLVKLGYIRHDKLLSALRHRVAKLLAQIIGFRSGKIRWLFLEDLPVRSPVPPVNIPHLLTALQLDDFEKNCVDELEKKWRELANLRVLFADQPPYSLNLLGLTGTEKRIVDRIRSQKARAKQLLSGGQISRWRVMGLILLLRDLGFVEIQEVDKSEKLSLRIAQTRTKYEGLLQRNHFELLGLHWSAYEEKIRSSYVEFKNQLDDASVPTETLEELRELRQKLRLQADEAFGTLSDKISRNNYRKKLVDHTQIDAAIRLYLDHADWALVRRDKMAFNDNLRRVFELDPGSKKGHELRALAREKKL